MSLGRGEISASSILMGQSKFNPRSEWYRKRHPEVEQEIKPVFNPVFTPIQPQPRQKGFIRNIVDKILDL